MMCQYNIKKKKSIDVTNLIVFPNILTNGLTANCIILDKLINIFHIFIIIYYLHAYVIFFNQSNI